jgi:hypothetical protein
VVWLCVLIAAFALAFFGRDGLRSLAFGMRKRARARPAAADSLPGMSAEWLLAECGRLAQVGAAWPEISAAVNPQHDAEVEALLGRVRAAAMGEPLAILKAVEAACHAALDENEAASAFDALSLAARNSQWTSSAKW